MRSVLVLIILISVSAAYTAPQQSFSEDHYGPVFSTTTITQAHHDAFEDFRGREGEDRRAQAKEIRTILPFGGVVTSIRRPGLKMSEASVLALLGEPSERRENLRTTFEYSLSPKDNSRLIVVLEEGYAIDTTIIK